jgi:addiction module HigA family antidote
MKNNKEKNRVFNQGVLANGFTASKSEMNELKANMLKASNAIPDKMKIQYKLNALVFEMEEYLKNDSAEEVIAVGSFLQECIKVLNVKNKDLAEYLGMEAPNLSAVINGKRKLNIELADILGQIFNSDGKLWLDVQIKNDWIRYTHSKPKAKKKYTLEQLIKH